MQTPPPLHVLRGHTSPVNTIKFSNCGSFLISGTTEGEIKLWNVSTKRNVHSTTQRSGIVKLHELNRNTLVSHETSGNIALWSVGQASMTLINEWNPYVVHVAIGDYEPTIIPPLWNSTPVPVAKSAVDPNMSQMIAVAAGGRDSHYIDVLDIRQQRYAQTYKDTNPLGLCMDMAFVHFTGQPQLCGAFENGSLRWWDLRVPDQSLPHTYHIHSEPVICFDIDVTTCRGISGAADAKLSVFSFDAEQVNHLHSVDLPNKGIADLKIRGDKKLFATAGWDNRIRVYSWKKYTPLAILRFHSESVSCVDFPLSPVDGKFLLAGGSKDKRISLWDIYND